MKLFKTFYADATKQVTVRRAIRWVTASDRVLVPLIKLSNVFVVDATMQVKGGYPSYS